MRPRRNAKLKLPAGVTGATGLKLSERPREAQVAPAEENLQRPRNRVRIDVDKAVRGLNRAETGIDPAMKFVTAPPSI